ncbi:hypothetical protein CTA2_2745 [Colletotrichum tanaceti]|nr:hypothetical protein CTA2_2745 [Colletotrichum tanaceti]
MIRHQRVQMMPVAVRAAFWVRDSFSAGRAKSATPARTRAHCRFLCVAGQQSGFTSSLSPSQSLSVSLGLGLGLGAFFLVRTSCIATGMYVCKGEGGREGSIGERRLHRARNRTFITGALHPPEESATTYRRHQPELCRLAGGGSTRATHQKCTVLKPMGLSHMRLNQLACASEEAVELCHLLELSRNWERNWEVRKALRTWAPAKTCWRKAGRAALKKLLAGAIVAFFSLSKLYFEGARVSFRRGRENN